jgi:hypothetical protein
MTFGAGNLFFSKTTTSAATTGPMSGYLYQQEANRKWRIRVASAIGAVANFLLMAATSES